MKKDNTKKSARSKRKAKRKSSKSAKASHLRFLESAHPAVRRHLSGTQDLPTFLDAAGTLTLQQRKRLVEQALVLVAENFVHLPLKESMHGVDPVQKLRLIQHRLNESTTATMGSEYDFHRSMIDVFTSVRDLHTNYLLPAPFSGTIAYLPFDIEEYYDQGEPRYIATHMMQGFSHAHFKSGVEVKTLNGVPVRRAVDVSADEHAGSNLPARHARGVDGLTIRALQRSLPPNALWVDVGYIDRNGVSREMRQEWLVSPLLPDTGLVDADALGLSAASLGVDVEADIKQRARKMLFAPQAVAAERRRQRITRQPAAAGESLTTTLSGIFSAKSVTTPSGEFGYIRIFSFNVNNPGAFISEFARLVGLLPQDGLIIDVRGNGGGHIYASEGLLQLLTPVEITPEPTQFINTELNARICDRHKSNPLGIDLGPWVESIRRSVETGAIYSRGFPITPPEFANDRGQHYHGPVVLVTDARCYSATDIFAAGFQDHQIGHILGVDDNTGAGGANVWTHGLLRELLRQPAPVDPDTPYKTLPNGANMRVAIRRTLRVGEQAGTPVEDLGVTPDSRHALTRNDLLDSNVDLINRAATILAGMPRRRLQVTTSQSAAALTITADTAGIDRLDTYIDGRPVDSRDVGDGSHSYSVTPPGSPALLELAGYDGGDYVAARKLSL